MLEVAEEMATPSDTETSVKVAVRYVHTSGTVVALPVPHRASVCQARPPSVFVIHGSKKTLSEGVSRG